MEIFLLSFIIVLLAVAGMAAGVFAGRRPLSGSCGGASRALGAGIACGTCGIENDDGLPAARGKHGVGPTSACPGTACRREAP
jgi:hypothetical protein